MESQFTKDDFEIKHNISNYQEGKITINNTIYKHSLILTETQEIKKWDITNISEINEKVLDFLYLKDFILIIGTGAKHRQLDLTILAKSGVNAEIMSTKSACQTYTILAQEQRSVIAALII